MFISLRKKIGNLGMTNIAYSFVKILLASIIMGVIAKTLYLYSINSYGSNISLIISIIIGVLVYFGCIYFMKIKEVEGMVNTFKNKLRRGWFLAW